jgi:hypothetical protein
MILPRDSHATVTSMLHAVIGLLRVVAGTTVSRS